MSTDEDVPQVGITDQMALNLNILEQDPESLHLLNEMNHNISKPQKELMLWHQRIAHMGFAWLQDLMQPGKNDVGEPTNPPFIPTKHTLTCRVEHPKCASCIIAKHHRRTPGSQVVISKPEREMAIRRDAARPGDRVCVDQFLSSKPGRLENTYGKESDDDRYHGGTLFVDCALACIKLKLQISLRTGETLTGKHEFERFASLHGVTIKKYRADNHPFSSAEFKADIELLDQELDFSGVGAHFQNGVAERAIQTVTYWSRAMLLHQMRKWPEAWDEALWPFALEQAVYLWNNLPRSRSGLTPLKLFTGTKQAPNSVLSNARVWGCPAYVLDPKLQDGHKLPKWKKRSRLHCP